MPRPRTPEAYLLANQHRPLALLELLYDRGEYVEASNGPGAIEYQLAHIFHGHDPKPHLKAPPESIIGFRSQEDRFRSLYLRLSPTVETSFTVEQAFGLGDVVERKASMYELLFAYNADSPTRLAPPITAPFLKIPAGRDCSVPGRPLRSRDLLEPYQFITANGVDYAHLATLWDAVTLTPKEDDIVEALRILEPAVERLSFTSKRTSSGGVLVKLRNTAVPVPLSSMGDGMHRILNLVMSATTAQNGVLLVDEIDTGLYHGAQTDVWRLLIGIAQRLDVQVFATTHSWDCVAAFQEALAQSPGTDEGLLFRLEPTGEDVRPVKYSQEELAIVVRQAIEVR